jgi:hypothetical protein
MKISNNTEFLSLKYRISVFETTFHLFFDLFNAKAQKIDKILLNITYRYN